MPGENILVRAVLEDKLYTLNLIGGTVSSATDGTDPVPYEGENDGDTVVYRLPYDTQVTVTADEEEDGEMFVGWDYEMRKNRVGDPGQTEYKFSMPDRTLSVFGVFSETRHIRVRRQRRDGRQTEDHRRPYKQRRRTRPRA